jgi:hypothetical protein
VYLRMLLRLRMMFSVTFGMVPSYTHMM